MAPIKNVLIIGAGGNIGTPILEGVAAAGFNVTVLSRQSSKSTFGEHKVIRIDDSYPHKELVAAFRGQDAVISTITTAGIGNQENLIDAAIEAGVRRFVPSEFGCDNRDEAAVAMVPSFEEKLQVIRYLQARQDKLEWTAIITGPFFDWCLQRAFIGIDMKNRKATITEGGHNKFSTTTLAQIGAWVAEALKRADDTANQYVPVESFLTSQLEVLAMAEKVTGEKFTVTHQSGQSLVDSSRAGLAAGNFMAGLGLVQAAIFIPGYGSDFHDKATTYMNKFGFKPLDLEEEVRKAVAAIDA